MCEKFRTLSMTVSAPGYRTVYFSNRLAYQTPEPGPVDGLVDIQDYIVIGKTEVEVYLPPTEESVLGTQ